MSAMATAMNKKKEVLAIFKKIASLLFGHFYFSSNDILDKGWYESKQNINKAIKSFQKSNNN